MPASNKRSSLLETLETYIIYGCKTFYNIGPWTQVARIILAYDFFNGCKL
jgi:hypothetical protein